MKPFFRPTAFVLDVDGVLSSGQFLYSNQGKTFKIFGADDADALQLIAQYLTVEFVSADKRGFPISSKRIEDDLKFKVSLVSSDERLNWIRKRFDLATTIYMGDGFWDHLIFSQVGFALAPANAFFRTRALADYVTQHAAGDRAIAEAVLYIAQHFMEQSELCEGLR